LRDKYQVLDSIPLSLGEFEGIDLHAQRSLGITMVQTTERTQSALTQLSKAERSSFRQSIHFVLESMLYTLLQTSSILTSEQGDGITKAYRRRRTLIPDRFDLPRTMATRNLMFSRQKVWAYPHGTLGYYLLLNETLEHYLHPSDMVDRSIREFCRRNGYTNWLTLTRDESLTADLQIYAQVANILEFVQPVLDYLDFIDNWVYHVLAWYQATSNEPTPPSNPVFTSGYKVLLEAGRICRRYAIDRYSLDNLAYQFAHQSIPEVGLEVARDFLFLRRTLDYLPDVKQEGVYEVYASAFWRNVPVNKPDNFVRLAYNDVLTNLPAPGGLNTILLVAAAHLVNRAYIVLTRENRLKDPIYGDYLTEEVRRCLCLTYLAGRLLQKSDIQDVQLLGYNLQLVSLMGEPTGSVYDLRN